MKKFISLMLSVVMLLSVFSVCASAASTPDINKVVDIKSSGFENGKVTYTISLKPGVKLTGAIFNIKFDPEVLEPVMSWSNGGTPDYEDDDGFVFANNGAYVTLDENGKTKATVPGVYASGMLFGTDDTCSVSYVSIDEYENGSSTKPFMSFDFKVISSDRPKTKVEFFCAEFRSSDAKVDYNPEDQAPLFIKNDVTSTLNKINLIGVECVANGLNIKWKATYGAAGYRIFKEDSSGVLVKYADVGSEVTSYIDTKAIHNVKSTYTVRALDFNGHLDSQMGETISGVFEHTFGDWIVTLEPTCTKTGSRKKICLICGDVITETIGTIDHSYSTEWTIDKEATCAEPGSESRHCVDCDNKGYITVIPVDLTKHNYSDWVTEKTETCDTVGTRVKICVECGDKVHDLIPSTGHSYGSWHVEKASSCSENGSRYKECINCGEKIISTIPAKGHKASAWIVSKKATVNAPGSKYQKCTVCGVKIKTAKIAQLKCSTPKLKSVENVATGIRFTWNKVSGADNYEIYRKTDSGAWKKLSTVKGTATTYIDKSAKSGITYKYTVKAKNEVGLSSYNTTGLTIKYIATPALKALTSTKSGITLKWNKVTGVQGYVVYRKTGNGNFVKLATVKGATKVSYTDKKAKKGVTYTYKIKAYSGNTYSAYSNAKTIKDKY